MLPLSNLLKWGESSGSQTPQATARPANPSEINAALRLILGSGGRLAEPQQLNDFLAFAQQRSVDLNEMWVAERAGTILWAILPIPSPGRTVLFLTPNDPAPGHVSTAVATIIEHMCRQFASRDTQLAQGLIEPSDDGTRRIFEAHGFSRMAELLYLHAPVRHPLAPPALASNFELSAYSDAAHNQLAAAIIASYQDSLDCPALNGVRSIEDIIAGHKASGEFDPQYWYLLEERIAGDQRAPLGVLLLTRLPRHDTTELVYLGLCPAARGRGLGHWLMRRAFHSAAAMGASRLSLAVDATNRPALKLYYQFGLSKLGSKIAMMKNLFP